MLLWQLIYATKTRKLEIYKTTELECRSPFDASSSTYDFKFWKKRSFSLVNFFFNSRLNIMCLIGLGFIKIVVCTLVLTSDPSPSSFKTKTFAIFCLSFVSVKVTVLSFFLKSLTHKLGIALVSLYNTAMRRSVFRDLTI